MAIPRATARLYDPSIFEESQALYFDENTPRSNKDHAHRVRCQVICISVRIEKRMMRTNSRIYRPID